MNVTLPESVREWLEAHASLAQKTPDEFVLGLVLEAQKRAFDPEAMLRQEIIARHGEEAVPRLIDKARADLEAKLLEGLNSGPATPMTAEDWADIRREIRERRERRNGKS